jgi:hypothetical protein
VADAIPRLVYDPSANPKADYSHFNEMNSEDVNHYRWKAVSKDVRLIVLEVKAINTQT